MQSNFEWENDKRNLFCEGQIEIICTGLSAVETDIKKVMDEKPVLVKDIKYLVFWDWKTKSTL